MGDGRKSVCPYITNEAPSRYSGDPPALPEVPTNVRLSILEVLSRDRLILCKQHTVFLAVLSCVFSELQTVIFW